MSWAAWAIGGTLVAGAAVAVAGIAVASRRKGGGGGFYEKLDAAAAKMPADVLAAARKWSAAREIPLVEVMATILLESRGNVKAHAKTDKEDSRGPMQVNVNAHKSLLDLLKMRPDDLFTADRGIEAGTHIYAAYRRAVSELVAASKVPQFHPIATLTRLYYASPKYTGDMLRKAKMLSDTKHPFKDAETYVAHWDDAMRVAGSHWGGVS